MALLERLNGYAVGLRQGIAQLAYSSGRSSNGATGRTWELEAGDLEALVDLGAAGSEVDLVDDGTWTDLELGKLFTRIDGSVTPAGAQYLYAMMRRYQHDTKALQENNRVHQEFKANPAAAARLRIALKPLNRSGTAQLGRFLLGAPLMVPSARPFFYCLSALAMVVPFGMIVSPWFLMPTVALWITNIVVHLAYGRRVVGYASPLTSVALLLGSVPQVREAIRDLHLPEQLELETSAELAQRVRKKISLAFLRSYRTDDFTMMIKEYLNLFCLFELSAFCRAIQTVNQHRHELTRLFWIVARLDAFQGLAGSLSEFPSICIPSIVGGRSFQLVETYHPLLNNPVSNTIRGTGNSLLISGTNMSGKTTFIKTLGVNLVLAQTLGLCFAREATLPAAKVRTLINRQDTITSGQSYFFFEATQLLAMAKTAAAEGRACWFVLDEVFRGTNAVERVAAGAAVLGYLHLGGLVIASTHDHELVKLLESEFQSYHFSEVIEGSEATFDYRLRQGACTTRNAIRLLALAGYPETVVNKAKHLGVRVNVPVFG